MQIRVENEAEIVETTLAPLLEALQSITGTDDEIEAVVVSMLDEDRIHFVPERALAA